MSDTTPNSDRTWKYRFARPGDVEIEVAEFDGDLSAEAHARQFSESLQTPVIIHRLLGHVDWEYLTEVDERR
jgi:hypothetical protein